MTTWRPPTGQQSTGVQGVAGRRWMSAAVFRPLGYDHGGRTKVDAWPAGGRRPVHEGSGIELLEVSRETRAPP